MVRDLFYSIYVSKLPVMYFAMGALLLGWSVIGAVFEKQMRIFGSVLAVVAVAAILYATVISRDESGAGTDFVPFSTFERALLNREMYRSMLMNVFLFIPLGISLPFVYGGGTAQRIGLAILTGLLLSVTVEAVQYFGSLGMAETDDVISNTLGTLIGSCAYPLSLLWRKWIASAQKKNDKGMRHDSGGGD